MANTYVQRGDVLTLTAPTGGVTAGTPLLIGDLLVIPQETVAQTLPFDGYVTGVHTGFPKTTGTAWTEGAILYWDDSGKKATTVSTSNRRIGCAAAAAASGDATGTVRLAGIPVTAVGGAAP